jgi:hypothetical protein
LNSVKTSSARRIVSQSDVLPITTATKGKAEGELKWAVGGRKAEVDRSFSLLDLELVLCLSILHHSSFRLPIFVHCPLRGNILLVRRRCKGFPS